MRRLVTFLLGMVTGGLLLFGALNYHILRADDGFHLIPKTSTRLAATYVDIRKFTVADLTKHADIVEAIIRADKQELLKKTTAGALQNGLDRFLDRSSSK
jgi:hypothetical protein